MCYSKREREGDKDKREIRVRGKITTCRHLIPPQYSDEVRHYKASTITMRMAAREGQDGDHH